MRKGHLFVVFLASEFSASDECVCVSMLWEALLNQLREENHGPKWDPNNTSQSPPLAFRAPEIKQ